MYFFLSSFTFVHINSNSHCICYIISIIKTTYLFSYIGNSYDFKHVDIICRVLVSRISGEHTLQKLCWPTVGEKMHVVAFVLDSTSLDSFSKNILSALWEMKSFVVERGTRFSSPFVKSENTKS